MTLWARAGQSLAGLAAVILLAMAIAGFFFLQTRLDRELSDLPPSDRRALFERTLATLRTTCSQPVDTRCPSTAATNQISSRTSPSATKRVANSLRASSRGAVEELNHGHRLHHHHLRFLPADLGLRAPLREGLAMTSLLVIGGVLATLLLVYLGFALLFPEKLS